MVSLLTFDILVRYTRPVVSLGEDLTCLIDSGADTPVWTQGSTRLEESFQASLVTDKKFILAGFGTGHEVVDVYHIQDLCLKGKEGQIIFKDITVACTERPGMVADLILPATAFAHMNYKVCNLGVEYPVVQIEHERDEYYVSPIYSNVDSRILERVYSFTNETWQQNTEKQ